MTAADSAWRIAAATAVVAIVIVYAVSSGRWVATSGSWYQSLEQPWWQPPPWVFGLIWPYNFVILTIAGIAIAWNTGVGRVVTLLVLLVATVALALGWAYLFYVPHELTAAALCLTGAAVLTLPITALAFGQAVWLGVLLIPYQVWLFLAASLSWGYAANT